MTLRRRPEMKKFEMQFLPSSMVLVTGLFLMLAVSMLITAVIKLDREIVVNRKIGCVNRYLDHQAYIDECKKYIDEFKREQRP